MTQDDVRRIALALPEVVEGTDRFGFSVRGKGIAWVWLERSAPEAPRLPNPEVLAVRVAGAVAKEDLLALDPAVFFTEPHYHGFPAVLVRLPAVAEEVLEQLLEDAWAVQAPKKLLKAFREKR